MVTICTSSPTAHSNICFVVNPDPTGCSRDLHYKTHVFDAINNKRINAREKLGAIVNCINVGLDINVKNYSGETLLICSVRKRLVGCCRVLLESGCGVNIQDQTGRTALHYCFLGSLEASIELVNLLLEFGANPNIKDKLKNATPLHLALVSGKKDIFHVLVIQNGDLSELKAVKCLDLIINYGFKLHVNTELVIQRLYNLDYPVFKCRRIVRLMEICRIDCTSASVFLDGLYETVPHLKNTCRLQIRQCLGKGTQCRQISDSNLPMSLQRFIRMERLDINVSDDAKTVG